MHESSEKKNNHAASEKIFNITDYFLFSLLTLLTYSVFGLFLAQWFALEDWFLHPVTFWGLTLILFSRFATSQFRWWLLPFLRKPLSIMPPAGLKVGVATTFVPAAEPIEMLEQTVTALVAMDYPHDTWVLDEGDDVEVQKLCERLGALHFSRKNLSEYQTADGIFRSRTKYGNYNSWFHETGFEKYEIIATLTRIIYRKNPFFLK